MRGKKRRLGEGEGDRKGEGMLPGGTVPVPFFSSPHVYWVSSMCQLSAGYQVTIVIIMLLVL